MKELVTVVIPVFDTKPTDQETSHLDRCFDLLGNFPIQLITANQMDLSHFETDYYGFETYRYDDRYFTDREGFNRLLLSQAFYEQFGWSEFIFLFEPKAFLVKNELRHWCKQAYDFIQNAPNCPSLRRVEKFEKITKKRTKVQQYLELKAEDHGDFPFWKKEATGFFSSLRTPPDAVLQHYAQIGSAENKSLPERTSPFILL